MKMFLNNTTSHEKYKKYLTVNLVYSLFLKKK